jgi:hypothetical protein
MGQRTVTVRELQAEGATFSGRPYASWASFLGPR